MSAMLFSVIFFAAGRSYGDPVDIEARELSLDEFIQMSCGSDRVFEEILVENLKLNYLKKLKLPADDIVLSVKNSYAAFLRPDKGNPEYEFSLSKLFPYTGTEIEAGYASLMSGPEAGDVDGEFYAYISQPVARNAFGRTTRLLDKIVGMEMDIARYQIVEAYESYLSVIINVYYDWNEAYENLKTAENSYNESVKMIENVRERAKKSIALPVDVNKVLHQVLLKEETLIEARKSVVEYENLLRKSIGYDIPGSFIPRGSDQFDGVEIDLQKDYEKFRKEGRTSLILDMLEEKSALEVDKDADALLPSIDLFAEYRIKGADRYLEKDDKRVYAGLSFEYPFPSQVERARLETTKVDHRISSLDRINTHTRIYTELRNIYEEIVKQKKLIRISEEKIRVSEEIVHDDKKNYSYGRVVLNNLIDEVNRLDVNRFRLIQNNIRLKKLIIQWLTITDQLVRETPDL